MRWGYLPLKKVRSHERVGADPPPGPLAPYVERL